MNAVAKSLVPLIVEFQRKNGGIRLAYLFGSQADERARVNSDVDVAVLLQDWANALLDLKLADVLASTLGKPVDVIVLNHVSPILQHEVIRSGVRLMEVSPMARRLYELRAFRDYVDVVFFQEKRQARVANG